MGIEVSEIAIQLKDFDGLHNVMIMVVYERIREIGTLAAIGTLPAKILSEGYASLRPSPTFMGEVGKKTLNWGKGYSWNPAAFLDRQKTPR